MQELQLHMGAVLLAALARFVLGWVWYSPILFYKPWIKSAGITESKVKGGMLPGMATWVLGSLVMSFVLAHAIKYAQMAGGLPPGLAGGLIGGFVNWFGLVAVAMLDGVMAEKRPFKWFAITGGYHLVTMMTMGVILSIWA